MSESKICPLLSISDDPGSLSQCEGARCAWWRGDKCAIVELSSCIDDVGSDVQEQTGELSDLNETVKTLAAVVSHL